MPSLVLNQPSKTTIFCITFLRTALQSQSSSARYSLHLECPQMSSAGTLASLLPSCWEDCEKGQHPEIDSLRRQARSGADSPRLLPLSPSLIPPDSPLLRNLGDGTFSLFAVAVTPDGRRAIYGGEDEDAVVLDLEAGQEIMRLSGHQSWINAVAISSDGKLVVTGSDDNTAKVWNLETKEEVSTFRGHTSAVWSVAFTPDELWVVSGSNDQTIRVWDLKNGCEKAVLRGHDGPVWSLAVSPKQDILVSGSKDGTLRVWDLGSGQHPVHARSQIQPCKFSRHLTGWQKGLVRLARRHR